MNTQSLLFERSGEIPEGLYVDLMNKLKIDFVNSEQERPKTVVIILSKSLPRRVLMSKQELVQQIIKASVDWEDREEILCFITKKRIMYSELQELCSARTLPIMKVNPRWAEQHAILSRNAGARELFNQTGLSPNVLVI